MNCVLSSWLAILVMASASLTLLAMGVAVLADTWMRWKKGAQ